MTADAFRNLALSLPEAVEQSHMCHPDFRVGGKIFAILWTDEGFGTVKLTPDQQARFVEDQPKVFQPVPGSWGVRGYTQVALRPATKSVVFPALIAAWRNTAPKRLLRAFEDQ